VTGAALLERPSSARLVARGADRRDFLDRMASADLARLAPGGGAATYFLERTGRMIDRAVVLERGDEAWLLGSEGRAEALVAWLSRHVIADDVTIEDRTDATFQVTILGEAAADAVARLGVGDARALARWEHRPAGVVPNAFVVRAEDVGGAGYHVVGARGEEGAVRSRLGAIPRLSPDDYRALRVTAGVPEWGAEYGERTIPLEARQTDHVSFTKGCYVGQEVVARLHNYRRVKRSLVRVRVHGDVRPGDAVLDAGREVGVLTSVAVAGAHALALGYVEAGLETPGRRLVAGAARAELEVLTLTPLGDPE
jgi:folate-binding protein YgfZ